MDKEKKAEYNKRWREKQKEKRKEIPEEIPEEIKEPEIVVEKKYLDIPETKTTPPRKRNKPIQKKEVIVKEEPEVIEEELTEEQLEEMINNEVERRIGQLQKKKKVTVKENKEDDNFFFSKGTLETMKNQAIQIIMPMTIPLLLRALLGFSQNSVPSVIARPRQPFQTSSNNQPAMSLEQLLQNTHNTQL